LDNTDQSVEETATAVVEWLSDRLDSVSDGVIDQSS
jgi:regulator of PEP synthase PpsR (kinase-PPPase family)